MSLAIRTRHLEIFLAVAKAGSMQRAAREAHLTQPAISKLIVELEEVLGAALFERSRRGVALTECGQAFVGRARLLLNDLENAREEIAAIARGEVGIVRVGVLPVAEARLLASALLALRRSAPNIAVQVEDGTRDVMLQALRRGEIDCVIGRLDAGPGDRDLHVEKLIQLPIAIVSAASHPLARSRRAVTWAGLARYPWILPRLGAPIRTAVDREFVRAGMTPPVPAVESTSFRLVEALVAATDMIGVMSDEAAVRHGRSGGLARLTVEFTGELPHIGVTTRTPQVPQAVATFLKALREQCRTAKAA